MICVAFVFKNKVTLCELQKCKRWRRCYFLFLENIFNNIYKPASLCSSSIFFPSLSLFHPLFMHIWTNIFAPLSSSPLHIVLRTKNKTVTSNCLLHHGQWCSRECVSRPLEPPAELSSVWSKSPNLSLSDRLHCVSLTHTRRLTLTLTHTCTQVHILPWLWTACWALFHIPSTTLKIPVIQFDKVIYASFNWKSVCFSVHLMYLLKFVFYTLVRCREIKHESGLKCD